MSLIDIHADLLALSSRVEALLPGDAFDRAQWEPLSSEPLDTSRLDRPAFDSDFQTGEGTRILPGDSLLHAEWYAGAQGGPYGLANVGTAVREDVYVRTPAGLVIRAHRTPGTEPGQQGGWYSGHLQTVNIYGQGFARRTGYFEARMRFPASYLAWPAFWLKPRRKWTEPTAMNLEIDVVEWYGLRRPTLHDHVVHVGGTNGVPRRTREITTEQSADVTASVHAYGVLLDDRWIIIYIDRKAVARFPMIDLFRCEWYPQVTLGVKAPQDPTDAAQALDPMDLLVESVTVWGLL